LAGLICSCNGSCHNTISATNTLEFPLYTDQGNFCQKQTNKQTKRLYKAVPEGSLHMNNLQNYKKKFPATHINVAENDSTHKMLTFRKQVQEKDNESSNQSY